MDSSVALFDARKKHVDLVWYRQLGSTCGSIVHSGDNLTGEGDGDDEAINIDLAALPANIHYLVFTVTVFTFDTVFNQVCSDIILYLGTNQRCRVQVKNLEVVMRHGNKPTKGDELFTMSLSNLSDQAMLVGQLIRKGPEWSFAALGEPCRGKDAREVLQVKTLSTKSSSCDISLNLGRRNS